MDQSNGDLLADLQDEESVTVRAELSNVLEESVESLSAAVGGWSSELARSSERSSRLEATIASLSAAMETWKTDMARTSARAEERLLRALEILESRMGQHQTIVGEIRDSQGSSSTWLTRAMEEWKAEIRYGSGLTEVRLLSAVEGLEAKVGEVQEAGTQVRDRLLSAVEGLEAKVGEVQEAGSQAREHLSAVTSDLGTNLSERMSTVQAVQDETRAWFEAAATAVGNDTQVALGRLRDLIGAIDSLKGDIRQLSADAEAAEAETKAALMGRINEMVGGLSDARSAGAADSVELRREMTALREGLVAEVGGVKSTVGGLSDSVAGQVSSLGVSLTEEVAAASAFLQQDLAALRASFDERLAALPDLTSDLGLLKQAIGDVKSSDPAAMAALMSSVEEWKAAIAASTTDTETRLLRALESIDGGVSEAKSLSSGVQQQIREALASITGSLQSTDKTIGGAAERTAKLAAERTSELVASSLSQLEAKVAELLERDPAVFEPGGSTDEIEGQITGLEGQITELRNAVGEWHAAVGTATAGTESKLVRALEAIETAINTAGGGPEAVSERLTERLDLLEQRLARAEAEGSQRDERLEEAVRALVQSIDDWRAKGRQAADRNKERVSSSLEALEARLLENREDESDYRDLMRKELAALTEAVDNLGDNSRDSAKLMRGLEELDEGLLRNRDELAHLADTFEAQFEIFEARVGDSVAARLDELERRIQERNKALVTLLLGPRPENSSTAELDTPPPRRSSDRTSESTRTPVDRPGQQARRRR